ncbi:MAG: hypothetical protein JSS17_01595 [Proteobacteria bacterium]|nr:hypothetical protein [Pseudomonadota bacterium]
MKLAHLLAVLAISTLVTLPVAQAKGKSGGSSSHSKSYSSGSGGSHSVRGHIRKDGTYVQPHRATNRNGTKTDNWSTQGNVNPYTGKPGTVDPGGNGGNGVR